MDRLKENNHKEIVDIHVDRSKENNHKDIVAVRSALTAFAQAMGDAERQATERTLLTAGMALSEKRDRLYCQVTEVGWLKEAMDWLSANRATLTVEGFMQREDRWFEKLALYEEMCRTLNDTSAALGRPFPAKVIEVVAGVDVPMAQEGLL